MWYVNYILTGQEMMADLEVILCRRPQNMTMSSFQS